VADPRLPVLSKSLRYDLSMATSDVQNRESLRLELQQALETFRTWSAQATQAFGVMATGGALLVTYGFAQRLASILFLASILPIAALSVYLQIASATAPLITLSIRIERKLGLTESLAATYARTHLGPLTARFGNIENLTDDQLRQLDHDFSRRLWLTKLIPMVLYATTILSAGVAIISLTVYHYKFM
jgi:hypothetical protein